MDDRLSFLAGVPLFEGIPNGELEEVARVMESVELEPGDALFRQGDEADGLHVLQSGPRPRLQATARRKRARIRADRARRRARRDPLLDGGVRSGTCGRSADDRALPRRADFTALVSRLHPTAFAIKRQILRLACERLRLTHSALVELLGGGPPADAGRAETLRSPARGPP